MYRFRNGQDNQLNIDFAYGGRLLSKHACLCIAAVGTSSAAWQWKVASVKYKPTLAQDEMPAVPVSD